MDIHGETAVYKPTVRLYKKKGNMDLTNYMPTKLDQGESVYYIP